MNHFKMILVIWILILGFSDKTLAKECRFVYVKGNTKVEWTGFKTTKKVGVKGGFDRIEVSGMEEAEELSALLESMSFSIDTASVNSGDPARDSNLRENFFNHMRGGRFIRGYIFGVKGSHSGKFFLHIFANERSYTVPMSYKMEDERKFTATGSFDFLRLGMKESLGALNRACNELHKGPDGVSKTWSDVELRLSTVFERANCPT